VPRFLAPQVAGRVVLASALLVTVACSSAAVRARGAGAAAEQQDWIQLFNGRDLSDWDIKFAGHDVHVNLHNTFRVENGVLQVRYDEWSGFNGEFGHIFNRVPYSYYVVAAEYRFVGDQVTGAGPRYAWARRNNGIMIDSQSAASMGRDQDFPISIEVQLLGGLGEGARSTANLCTPGTHVMMHDTIVTRHCINSSSRTYDGDQWVRVEVLVLGDSLIKHIVQGDTVLSYARPQIGGGVVANYEPAVFQEGKLLAAGYIALQAETAPIEFRKVELLPLIGCMDPRAPNYKSYYVRSDPSACR
jgi:hypothetical protein